jgi:hypothetical protein
VVRRQGITLTAKHAGLPALLGCFYFGINKSKLRAFGKRRPKRLLCITHANIRRDQQGFDLQIAFDDNSSIEATLSFEAVEGIARMFGQLAAGVRAHHECDSASQTKS